MREDKKGGWVNTFHLHTTVLFFTKKFLGNFFGKLPLKKSRQIVQTTRNPGCLFSLCFQNVFLNFCQFYLIFFFLTFQVLVNHAYCYSLQTRGFSQCMTLLLVSFIKDEKHSAVLSSKNGISQRVYSISNDPKR